jgi:hypothetical protein
MAHLDEIIVWFVVMCYVVAEGIKCMDCALVA